MLACQSTDIIGSNDGVLHACLMVLLECVLLQPFVHAVLLSRLGCLRCLCCVSFASKTESVAFSATSRD